VRIYLDSAPVIYAVEQTPGFFSLVDERLTATNAVLVASDLTRMECRVKPLRDNDADLLGDYDRFFDEALSECVSLTRQVLDLATEIRARYGLKTPDSIHLGAKGQAFNNNRPQQLGPYDLSRSSAFSSYLR
jgi:uncharacterized protein